MSDGAGTLAARLAAVRGSIAAACHEAGRDPAEVTLLPVSKTFGEDVVREAVGLGLRRFGENKVQEIQAKAAGLADERLDWVVIGHLQTNKAKAVAKLAAEVQSLDRLDLAVALDKALQARGRAIDVLVQVKTSREESKFGLAPEDLPGFLDELKAFSSLRLRGLMTLAERLGPSGRLSPVATADWREALLDHLLNGQRHGLSDAIRTFSGQAERLPRALRVARDRLADNAGEPLDLAGLACAAGIGIRALQLGFRRHFGVSISEMLLDMRLAGLHARLAQARPDASITEIAFDLGFTHLGRMAGAYREKFGETPSATLRRRMS